ncbi:ABC transporter ATP-binding protein [Mycolicibacterium neoaurum]|uniref:ATP-binding cassette domain-containing protein n=1 Tax=Mycolicibacterium neoaurum TaxID=1795 RepID=UPI00248D1A7A|nr:ABC transporter ATP-binding protein [Mycolicibacterium neoaurum]MDO3401396.1 ABC transporter ATP-binding protein [Mycolicibacterium neoaurum]WBP93317.1 ABC transporter ATP-binding protein [Mycolicibacterium neoaurum]WBS07008.1 ABC transporter ATP-binding protein [Mycolicibacterium neoaurum]
MSLLVCLRSRDWLVLFAVSALAAASPLVTLLIVRYLIDHVAELTVTRPETLVWIAAIWVPIAAYFLVNVIADSAETLQLLQISTLRDQIGLAVEDRTVTKALAHHDLALFDRPEIKKLLTLAANATEHAQYLVQLLSNLMTGLLLAVPTLIIAGSLGLWIPLLVVATTIPATLMQLRYERKAWDVEASHVDLNNRAQQLRSAMLNPRGAGDIRAYLLHASLLPRWRSHARTLITARRMVKNRGAVMVLLLATLSGAGLLMPYGFIIGQAISGDISLGTLALFIGLIPELRRSLFIVCANAGELTGAARQLNALWQFEDTQPAIALDPHRDIGYPLADSTPTANMAAQTIAFEDVAFGYDHAGAVVLSDINLILPAGSTTLLVGENGAGKTTLAKLLCRFYDPTHGSVTVDGIDLRDIDIVDYRRRTAVLVQDPARLPLSVRDCLQPTAARVSDVEIVDALRDVGLLDKIERTPDGLDTELSSSLNTGTDLSGGQWQRLAIARFLLALPDATVAVIDEPTTALDPIADHDLSELIFDRCAGKTTLIVSHRLHLAPYVAQVAFISRGLPLEVAPHHQLTASNATYRRMVAAR